ncbi:MAG: glycoside hydrolase [Campylobacter sp.]|nr:glycoside hydrolase [Campylobacter sp.]
MKKFALAPFILIFIVACSSKDPDISYSETNNKYQLLKLDLPQNAKLLSKVDKPAQTNGQNFKDRYFKVWEFNNPTTSKKEAFWGLNAYKNSSRKTYIAPSRRAYLNSHFDQIYNNANTNAFGSVSRHAITTKNTFLKNAPSHEPIFYNFDDPGEGYPFDYLSNSTLGVNYPLYVSHFSKDRDFVFVQNDVVWGWIDARDIYFVNENEKLTMKNSEFITILKDKTPVYDMNNKFLFYARVGTILMLHSSDKNNYYGRVFTENGLINYHIAKDSATKWPATIDTKNVQTLIDSVLGEPYGWGGFGHYRDCSLLTKDFLATFGYWLPRNSKAQSNMYTGINLNNMSNARKLDIIKAEGVPYLTLLYMPGHVMIYTGIVNSQVSITHSAWALKTKTNGKALFGQTAITTLEIGKNDPNIDNDRLLLSRITKMVIVAPELKADISETIKQNLMMSFVPNSTKSSDTNTKAEILEKTYDIKVKDNRVFFKDGSSLIFDDKKDKSEDELLNSPDIEDSITLGYPNLEIPPKHDIGRIRNHAFLGKIYGQNRSEIESNLTPIIWIDGKTLYFNSKNGAALALTKVVSQLNDLIKKDPNIAKYLQNPSGTYNYRKVAGTNYLSAHSYGIAIDINYDNSNYWRNDKTMTYTNSIPENIVEIFEQNGFIWGGRWKHYDTMHFEYRPELAIIVSKDNES